jgi:tetratricopeptide (TPR) repeat protein
MILVLALLGLGGPPQSPEVISPFGEKFYADADTKGAVAKAEAELAADPKNVELLIKLGRAQVGIWRLRDAVATFSRAIALAPQNGLLYRLRGHRYITMRRFDEAQKDLERATQLPGDKPFDYWYHLGLAYYLQGRYDKAAPAYERALAEAHTDDNRVAASDWLYMTYRRAKRAPEAARVLEKITPTMDVKEDTAYYARLLFYKGLKKETDLREQDHAENKRATLWYGVGNFFLCQGDVARARQYFDRTLATKSWQAFAYIASERDLRALAPAKRAVP